jgi:hypothetical protein
MFSICEEPVVMSGNQALAFVWKAIPCGPEPLTTTTAIVPIAVSRFLDVYQKFERNPSLCQRKGTPDHSCQDVGSRTTIQHCNSTEWFHIEVEHVRWRSGRPDEKVRMACLISRTTTRRIFEFVSDGIFVSCPSHLGRRYSGRHDTVRYLSAISKTKIPNVMVKRMERVKSKLS